jgi:hypothetical protein
MTKFERHLTLTALDVAPLAEDVAGGVQVSSGSVEKGDQAACLDLRNPAARFEDDTRGGSGEVTPDRAGCLQQLLLVAHEVRRPKHDLVFAGHDALLSLESAPAARHGLQGAPSRMR